MTDWVDIIGYSVGGAMLLMMTLGIFLSAYIPAIDRWSRRYFITFFSMLLLSVAVFFVDILIYKLPDIMTTERFIVFGEFLTVSALMPMPAFLLLHWCGESIKSSVLFRIEAVLWGVLFFMLIAVQFTDEFYYLTPDSQLVRGTWFALLPIPMILMMLLNIAGTVKRRKKLSKRHFTAILVYLLPMTVALFFYLFNYIAIFVILGMAICALMMFGLIISDNMEQYMRQQREIANQRASVMALQMRPHFICNTMMGIYYLCDQNPSKAKQITLDFTNYLRKNFTAFASEDTVPFSDELEHTRAYLAVEQAQFEDVLFVSFDTPHTLFRVPPLTLQPIVENAVKHGLNSSNDSIHISVVTAKTDSSYEIIVEDDGSGFDPVDDNEPHTALNNIRQRLELMCKGQLIISERGGGGTSVKVTIPASER